jgi:thiol-disulfide isomerase/thioredoxin
MVYDFWATWCLPCLRNMPKINALAEEIGSDDVLFMTISQDTDINVWKKKLADEKWNALSHGFLDPTQNESEYEMPGIPFYVVVDQNGIIQAAGNRSSLDIRDEIENIVRTSDKKENVK